MDLILRPLLKTTIEKGNRGNDLEDINYDFYDINVTLIGRLSKKNRLIFDFLYSEDKFDIKDEDIVIDGFLKWRNTALSVKLETEFNPNLYLDQYLLYSSYENTLNSFQAEMNLKILSKIADLGYKNRLTYKINDQMTLLSRFQYTYHDLDSDNTSVENIGNELSK